MTADNWNALLSYGLLLLAGFGGGVTLAVNVVKSFSEKWLDDRFKRALEKHKSELTMEVESFKSQINRAMDRRLKLQRAEFDALREVWPFLNDAYNGGLCNIGLVVMPNLDQFEDDLLETWIQNADLTAAQKIELRKAPNKNELLLRYVNFATVQKGSRAFQTFYSHLQRNAVFLPLGLCQKLDEFGLMINRALSDQRLRVHTHDDNMIMPNVEVLYSDGARLLDELESEIRSALEFPTKLD